MASSDLSNLDRHAPRGPEAAYSSQSAIYEALGVLVRAIGRTHFYEQLAEILAKILGCDRWLIVRYSRYAVPEFIVNRAMTDDAIEFYFQQLYHLDPVFRMVRAGPETGVLCLSRLHAADHGNVYFEDLFRTARIFDEVQLLFSAPGRVCIVAGFERSDRTFSDSEVEVLERMFPLLEAIHETHIDAAFRDTENTTVIHQGAAIPHCFQLIDKAHQRIHATPSWLEREQRLGQAMMFDSGLTGGQGTLSLDDDIMLHWEQLPESFAPAPGGYLCVIEENRSSSIQLSFAESVENFARDHELTRRESEIVALVFGGYPNQLIARKLNLSVGSVRNRRHALYEKLDITTERELFNLFITHIRENST